MKVRVAGVSHRDNYPNALLDIRDYMDEDDVRLKVELVRDPTNMHDENAIKVLVPALGEDEWVGFIPGDLAEEWAPRLDGGRVVHAWVSDVPVDQFHTERPGLEIEVRWAKEEARVRRVRRVNV